MPAISDDQLYQLLKENEYVPKTQLEGIKEVAEQEAMSFYDALVEKDTLSDENLGEIIADFLKLPFISLRKISIPEEVLIIIPEEISRRHAIIAFEQEQDTLKIATAYPDNTELLHMIAQKSGLKLHVYYATEKDINNAQRFYKKDLQEKFDELLQQQVTIAEKAQVKDVPITKLVDLLVEYAYYNKASDIHIEPRVGGSITRFRIDGVLHDVLTFPLDLHTQIMRRIKVLCKLRTDEYQSAQDGKMQIKLDQEDLDVRVSIVPVVHGEDAVLRLLSSKARRFSLSDLGMSSKDLAKIKSNYEKPYGMILVTGPTGSGKTTSIYAILKILNVREKNIATIEDPVEYEIKGINQIQVNPKTNITFAAGLRSILRQDPDIIFVGEIRDEETADIAINAAMTGHLVLSTLHTNDAPTTMPRLIDMNIEPFLVASTVNVIIGQRLVRRICDSCKVSYTEDRKKLTEHFGEPMIKKIFGTTKEIRMYHGKGCKVCHQTGYMGRLGIFEVLQVTPTIEKLITAKEDAEVIKNQAIKEGMTSMFEDGLSKVQQGVTTVDEILRATKQ